MTSLTSFLVLLLGTQHVYCWVTKSKAGLSQPSILRDAMQFTIPKFANASSMPYPSPLHNIYVRSVLSDEEASTCLHIANNYAMATGAWSQPDKNRHTTYSTCDFPLEDCESLSSYLQSIGFHNRMWNHFSSFYGISYEEMSYLDCFCAHYQTPNEEHPNVMDRLEPHRDGSLLSYSVTLTPPEQFEGGGTYFEALRDEKPSTNGVLGEGGIIRPLRAGDAVLHSGKLLHGAHAVHSGTRTVLVGFLDVAEWRFREGVLSTACRDWGRCDVASLYFSRQHQQSSQNKVWHVDQKWYSRAVGANRSFLLRALLFPTFLSLENRADPEFQRRQRLEIEDNFLRAVLVETEAIGIVFEEEQSNEIIPE